MMYVVNTNEPGYLPDSEGNTTEDLQTALDMLWEEMAITLANDPEYTIGDRNRFDEGVVRALSVHGEVSVPIDGYNHFISLAE